MENRTYGILIALSLITIFSGIVTLVCYHAPLVNATSVPEKTMNKVLRNGDSVVLESVLGINNLKITYTGSSEMNGFSKTTFTFAVTVNAGDSIYAYTIYTHYETPFYINGRTFMAGNWDSINDTVVLEEAIS